MQRLGVQLDLRRHVGELTVASRQMVEIAKALSQEADLLVMDEPSAILAGHELEQLFKIIRSLNEQGVTIIYISHRLEEIFQIADEVTVLKDGEVVGTHPVAEIDRPQLIGMMVGRSLDEVFPKSERSIGDVVLEARDVSTDHLPNSFSLSLRAGEILGLAGMVGSGRTELARAIFGADRIRSGSLIIDGKPVSLRNPGRAMASGLALVPEDRKTQGLFMGLPVRNNISMATVNQLARFGLIQRKKEAERVEQARQNLDISMASPAQEVQYLSGGNQQKVVLAKWLETAPKVIILDEPTRGVDVGAKVEIYQLMRQLTERGVGILMISSELLEVIGMSDRVLVMHNGSIAGEIDRVSVTEEKIVELATTGELQHHIDPNDGGGE
jgi:ribose transport system ATP-binding protein